MAVAVDQCGVEEVDTGVAGDVERAQGFVVVRADPHGLANAPGAVADVADSESGLAEVAVVHGRSALF